MTWQAKPCKRPTAAELLRRIGADDVSQAARFHAADELSDMLRIELERKCAELFPDFYWSNSHSFTRGADSYCGVQLPESKRVTPDGALTLERDAALRALGFTHFNGERLGLTHASVDTLCTTGEP